MSLERKPEHFSSLALRITAWFLVVFGIGLLAIFVIGYVMLDDFLMAGPDRAVMFELEEARGVIEKHGKTKLEKHLHREAEEFGAENVYYRVFKGENILLCSSDLSSWSELPDAPLISPRKGITLFLGEDRRPVRIISLEAGKNLIIEGGINVADEYEHLTTYRSFLAVIGISILLLAGLTGYWAVQRVVSRIDQLSRLTRSISGSRLGVRIPVDNPHDELGQLALTLNKMLDRIEVLITSLKQVSDDVAHELRSPVTKIRARAELALSGEGDTSDQIGLAENTIEECDGLLNLINSMLDIAEADASLLRLQVQDVDIVDVIQTAIEFFEPIIEQQGVAVNFDMKTPLFIKGDLSKLQRVISNILDNALKYTQQDGNIDIDIDTTSTESITLSISDNGIGIRNEEIPRLFDRFYRVDESRSLPGNGLGLTMSRALVRLHGGEMSIKSTYGDGTTVILILPRDKVEEIAKEVSEE